MNDVTSPQCLEDLNFFHPGLSRNTAEAVLLSNSDPGTYLLRESKKTPGHYAVSARCHSSVKHFQVEHNKKDNRFVFGVYTFYSFKELLEHFQEQPILANDAGDGVPVVLRYPYPNDVSEPSTYAEVTDHMEMKPEAPEHAPDFHVGSKEGYLIKRGGIVKNWKRRWFVVQRDEMAYYVEKGAKKPQKVWDLNTLLRVTETDAENKKNTFCLMFTDRLMYCLAASPVETEEWISFFQWKIDHFKKQKILNMY